MLSTDAASTSRTDTELLAAHVAGDPHAFEELFRRYHPRLHRVARGNCSNPEDAADAIQDAMLAVHRGAAAFRQQSAVGSWLHRILINACVDRLRHNKSRATIALDEEAHPVADRTTQIDTAVMVHRAVAQLPPDQRAVVVAVDLHGYSVGDAARLLGIPEGTVKSRRARARMRLAAMLTRPGEESRPAVPDT